MKLYDFHGGIHPPEYKHLSNQTAIRQLPLPPTLVVPLSQHIGNPAKPIVNVGERVLAGQTLAKADGHVSAAIHAPTSGTVVDIAMRPFAHPSGLPDVAIVITPDGQHQWIEKQPLDWQHADTAQFKQHLQMMGVVGLGGAVFPTHLKVGDKLQHLVINGAECEPFITCDDLLMRERAADIVAGVDILRQRLQAENTLIGVEDNKPEAIRALQQACAGLPIEVVVVPTKYPSGGAKQLIRLLTGKEVPHGMRSTDLGVQCFNVATVYTMWRAVVLGEPVVSRIVTLTGAVKQAGNVEALIGTPLAWLLQQAEPTYSGQQAVVMGGPMMGFELPDLQAGLTKASNCLIVKDPALFPPRPAALPCIRCGACAEACPAQLQPMDLYWFAKAKNLGAAQENALFDCIECGACSYVCPSQIPLVDYYRFAKSEIWAAEREKKAADLARTRHEFRQFRLERDKAEKAARLAAKTATPPPTAAPQALDDSKRAAIEAAMKRAAEKKAQNADAPAAEAKPKKDDEAKKAAIQAAMERAAARKAAKESGEAAPAVETPAAKPAMDDAKKAAIQAAMERAAARKAAKESGEAAPAVETPAAKPAMDDAKKAAIQAAMERAAARKAAKENGEAAPAVETPAAKPAMDEEKKAAIQAAMARAAARKAQQAAEKGDPT